MEFVTTAARSARASRLSLLAEAAPSCQELDGYEKWKANIVEGVNCGERWGNQEFDCLRMLS
jgi:Zn ribbon nucleic-acid-binding protein